MTLLICACGSGSNERDVATCQVCGTSYYAGDSGGNYMNIAWSNMCNSCEAKAEAYQEIKDYYELN